MIDDEYLDYVLESIASPRVIIPVGNWSQQQISDFSYKAKAWLNEHCEADFGVFFYSGGSSIEGSNKEFEEPTLVAFFELKRDLVAFKLRWVS